MQTFTELFERFWIMNWQPLQCSWSNFQQKKKKKKLKFCLLFLSTGYKCWKIFDILCRYLSSRYRIYVLIIWQKSLCMIYLFFMINLDIPKPVFNNSIIFKKNIPAVSGAIAYSTSVSYCSISILSQPQ